MANIYVRSTDGSNADDGSTWALAKADLAGAAAIDAAGDNIYLSNAHSESTAGAISFAIAGTLASPVDVIAVSDSAAPPTAESTAIVTTTGAGNIAFSGSHYYVKNITFNAATGASTGTITCVSSTGAQAVFEDCAFNLVNTQAASRIQPFIQTGCQTIWKDCTVKFAAASQGILNASASSGEFVWNGGALSSGGTSPTTLILGSAGSARQACFLSGVDLSAGSSGMNIFGAMTGLGQSVFVMRNCKLPASWSGSLVTGTLGGRSRYEMWNCDSGDTNYRFQIETYEGSIRNEQTIVRTSGATDGTTVMAWKMATGANAKFPHLLLESQEIVVWNDTTGSSVTATVEILHFAQGAGASGALQDNEIWLQTQYLGTSGFPLSTFASDVLADIQGTAANQATSTQAWDSLATAYSAATNYVAGDIIKPTTPNGALYQLTTDAGTTAAEPTWGTTDGGTTVDATGRTWTRSNRQKLTVAFTPQEKGYVHGRVMMAKASKTVYICPKMSVA